MYSELPFLSAKESIDEACLWLSEVLLPLNDEDRQCNTNFDTLEQVILHADKAIAALNDRGRIEVEDGGQDYPGFGFVPNFRDEVVEPVAAAAADAITAMFKPFRIKDAATPFDATLVTESLIERIKGFFSSNYSREITIEEVIANSQPDEGC